MENDDVVKIMQLLDEATGNWFDVYKASDVSGNPVTIEVPRDVRTIPKVRQHLLRKGAAIEAIDDTAIGNAITMIAPVFHRAARTGWRNNNTVFVSLSFVVGTVPDVTMLPPHHTFSGSADQVQCCGTLDGWKEVVSIARFSTAMTTAICAAFAAPLLSIANTPNFSLVLTGPSRSGKSSAQLMAASVIGYGQELHLPDLNATPSGMLAAALSYNGHVLPLNEVASARGGKTEVYGAIRDLTYWLGNGRDLTRHPSWNGGGETGTFQCLPILSSELSPDAWAERNNEARDPGETARLINLPAVFPGGHSVFDRPPDNMNAEEQTTWEREQFRDLRTNIALHRGEALKVYIEYLLDDIADTTQVVQERIALFERFFAEPGITAIERDIVRKFGLIYTAGFIAIDAGVLPLDAKEVATHLRDACRDALDDLPDPERDLRADMAVLKLRLLGNTIVDADNGGGRLKVLLKFADGFRKRIEGGEMYVVNATEFIKWIPSNYRAQRVLGKLDDEGLLDHERRRTLGKSIEWAQKQVTWPDKRRVRSICFFFPGGLTELDRLL